MASPPLVGKLVVHARFRALTFATSELLDQRHDLDRGNQHDWLPLIEFLVRGSVEGFDLAIVHGAGSSISTEAATNASSSGST